MIVHRPAVPMSLLCPLLEVAENFNWEWPFPTHTAVAGVAARPVFTIARFNEKISLAPVQPLDELPVSAHSGEGAMNSSSSSSSSSTTTTTTTTTLPPTSGWTHMHLSTPPTHYASLKLCLEGRLNGSLCVKLEATRNMQLPSDDDQSGITVHALITNATSSPGVIEIETPMLSYGAFRLGWVWGRSVQEFSTLNACIAEIAQQAPGCRYEWSVGAASEVMIPGVVVPTEGELERLAETQGWSSTPTPLEIWLEGPGDKKAREEEEEEDDDEDDEDDEGEYDDDDEGDEDEDEDEDEE